MLKCFFLSLDVHITQ